MSTFLVRGFWGCRQEAPRILAERWSAFLAALHRVDDEVFTGWRESSAIESEASQAEVGVTGLARYIEESTSDPDAAREGYVTSLWTHRPGLPEVTVSISAGGIATRVADSVIVKVRGVEGTRHAVDARLAAMLRGLVEAWDVDWGEASEDEQARQVKRELGLRVTDLRCGRAGYLSAGRAALVPDGLPGTRTRTEHDGLLLDLTHSGADAPATGDIVEVNQALRAAGALEKLPLPFSRTKW